MLVITNVIIYGNSEADTVIIKRGRILKVGREENLRNYIIGTSRRIDGNGLLLLPGLIDSHMHLYGTFLSLKTLNLRNVRSIEELKLRLKHFAKRVKNGYWILGRGWDEGLFKERRLPNRYDIDEVVPDKPVVLLRICGHIALLNSKAMRVLNIDEELVKKFPQYIDVDENGRPTGIIKENFIDYLRIKVPQPSVNEVKIEIMNVLNTALKYGLTMVHSVSVKELELRALSELSREGKLPIRVRAYLDPSVYTKLNNKDFTKYYNDFFKILGIKIFADGSLGGRTAFLKNNYHDSNTRGLLLISKEELREYLEMSVKNNHQLAIHSIGDGALEFVLKNLLEKDIPMSNVRIEHASVTTPEVLKLISKLKPNIVVQPHFTISDFWIKSRLGSRAKYAYMFKTLINLGANVVGSSDSPVEPLNPWLSISAAITRGNMQCINPEESLSSELAIKLYTENAGKLINEEIGAVREGYYADLILVKDINTYYGYDLSEIRPKLVIVNGDVVYKENLED